MIKKILTTELEVSSANMFDISMIFKFFSGAPNCFASGAACGVFKLLGGRTFLLGIELGLLPETKTKKRAKIIS